MDGLIIYMYITDKLEGSETQIEGKCRCTDALYTNIEVVLLDFLTNVISRLVSSHLDESKKRGIIIRTPNAQLFLRPNPCLLVVLKHMSHHTPSIPLRRSSPYDAHSCVVSS